MGVTCKTANITQISATSNASGIASAVRGNSASDGTYNTLLNPCVFQMKETSLRLRRTLLDHVQNQQPMIMPTKETPDEGASLSEHSSFRELGEPMANLPVYHS